MSSFYWEPGNNGWWTSACPQATVYGHCSISLKTEKSEEASLIPITHIYPCILPKYSPLLDINYQCSYKGLNAFVYSMQLFKQLFFLFLKFLLFSLLHSHQKNNNNNKEPVVLFFFFFFNKGLFRVLLRTKNWEIASQIALRNCSKDVRGKLDYM